MTRVFLAAGVAALAIAAPASAQRGDNGKADRQTQTERSGKADRQKARAERQERTQVRADRLQRQERVQARTERPQRQERIQQRQVERQARVEQPRRMERVEQRQVERQARVEAPARMTERREARANRIEQIDQGMTTRVADRVERANVRLANRSTSAARRLAAFRDASDRFPIVRNTRSNGFIEGCPPGLWMKRNGCLPPGQAAKLIGTPLATASTVAALSALPQSLQYLYPDTPNYYYRYGSGYLYEVDRETNLIASLLPLLAGGYVPGQYLPQTYMNSFVPDYYGYNSFYADSPYQCNRYANGVVYQVDCMTGMIEGVVPLYSGGYGYGQMLPSAYSYYNVPNQYRSLYYDNNDYGYWYAPGAIYQYDQGTNLITSVAALLSPGFSVGQQLPMGYDVYNVPYSYRANYYDTPDAWYRYNNGNIYRIDPTTQLVTAIVASILT